MGAANKTPDRQVSDINDIKRMVGDPDNILGPIPTFEEINNSIERTDMLPSDVNNIHK